jgi:hypothetical protein
MARALLGTGSQPSALGFGRVWNVATTTAPGTTDDVLKSKVVCAPVEARCTTNVPLVLCM